MKRLLPLLLILCLLAGCAPTTGQTPAAAELLTASAYSLSATGLDPGLSLSTTACVAGDSLYFLADAPMDVTAGAESTGTETAIFESRLYRYSLTDGSVSLLETYATQPEAGAESYSAVSALLPGGEDSLWVMENTTHYIFDLPKNFDETYQDKWEYYQYRGDTTEMRRIAPDGTELASFTLTNLQSAISCAVWAGDRLVCGQGETLLILSPQGELLSTIPAPAWVTAVTYENGLLSVLTDHEEDAVSRLYTLDLTTETFSQGLKLPVSVYVPSGIRGQTVYYADRGNLFSWDASAGQGQKLLDWQDYGRNRKNAKTVLVTGTGTVVTLSQTQEDAPEILLLTPSEKATAPSWDLVLGAVYPTDAVLDMVLSFNQKNSGGRIRVADYSEYDNLGVDSVSQLRLELSQNRGPDLLFSPDASLPITDLSGGGLVDLSSYLKKDEALQAQGLMTSVLDALRSADGKQYAITPGFTLSTTVARKDILGDEPFTSARAAELANSLSRDAFPPVEPYVNRDLAMEGHLSRHADLYFSGNTCTLEEAEFSDGLLLTALYPQTIDWKTYEKKGVPDSGTRVRQGNQLYLPGTYSSFRTLAGDMTAIGDEAVLAGWPDLSGGHAVEIWETWGITDTCRNKPLAWTFLRQILLEETQMSLALNGLPTNRRAFSRQAQASMQERSVLRPVTEEPGRQGVLTQSQYDALLLALETPLTLIRPVSVPLSMTISTAAADYFAGRITPQEACVLAQTAANAFLNP